MHRSFQPLFALIFRVLLLSVMATPHLAISAEVGRFPAPDDRFTLVVSTLDGGDNVGLQLNKVQSLKVKLVPKDPASGIKLVSLAFDARMPEHDHGMLLKPVAKELGPLVYRIDGIKLHMAGQWQLSFTLGVRFGASSKLESVQIKAPYQI